MDSGVLRDFIISITGGLLLVLFIIVGILGFLLYRQVNILTKSIKDTILTAKELDKEVKEVIKSSKNLFGMIK
jgi:hypothetical protein